MKDEKVDALFKRKKGHTLECFLFVFLFLGGFFSLGITGYRQRLKQISDTYYGAWDAVIYGADAALYDDLQGHAAVEETGRMELWGYVLDSKATVCGSMGYVDEAFIRMGRVELESGRLPERENEIAVEGSVLLKLGYEKKLGQEIELKVVEAILHGKSGTDSDGSQLTANRYYLSGIVNNYSTYWQEDGEWPVSCFIWKNPDSNRPAVKTHLYLSFKPEYSVYRKAVEMVCHNRGRWQTNGHREKGNSQPIDTYVDCYTVYHLLLYGLLLLAGITYLFYVLGCELWKNRELYRCLQFLGMGKKEFFRLCFQTKWKRVVACCFVGCFAGMITSVLFERVIRPFGEVGFSELYDVKSVLINLAMILVGSLVLFAIIVCFDYCITRFDGGVGKKPHRKYQRKRKFSVSHCFQFFLDRKRRLIGWLLCGITVMILICSNTSWMFFRDYRFNQEKYPYDYIFGGYVNFNRDSYRISKSELVEIFSIKGIKETYYYSVDTLDTIFHEKRNLSVYENYFDGNGNQIKNNVLLKTERKTVIGISKGILNTYGKDMVLDTDLFQSGGIILYLPDLYLLPSGQIGSEFWMKSNNIDPNYYMQRYREETIKIGDEIQVELERGAVNLKVAGILRGLEENVPILMFSVMPYSIICSYDVYEALFGEEAGYSCVMLNTDDSSSQTDLELSKTSVWHLFQNYKSQREQILTKCIIYLFFSVFLTESAVFLSLLWGRKGRNGKQKQVRNRIYQFHMLGMSLGEMKKEIKRKDRKDSFVCVLLADGIFIGIQFLLNLFKYEKCFDETEKLYEYLWDYVFSKTAYNINFPLLFAVSLFLYLLFRMLQYWNMHCMLNDISRKCG